MIAPAFAADRTTTYGTTANGGVTINVPVTKIFNMNDADTTLLNDYNFTMVPGVVAHTQAAYAGGPEGHTTDQSPTPVDGAVRITKEAFNDIHALTEGKKTVVSNTASNVGNTADVFTVHFDPGEIGQFHYTVAETDLGAAKQAGITQDTTIYDVVFTIENADTDAITGANNANGNVICTGVTVAKSTDGGTTWEKTGDVSANTQAADNERADRGGAGADINNVVFNNTFHTANVDVLKTVNGQLGDKTKDFTFTFNVQKANNEAVAIPETYKLYKYDVSGAQVDANTELEGIQAYDVQTGDTFTLKHNEHAVIKGIPETAKYNIQETSTTDYTTALAVKDTGAEQTEAQNVIVNKSDMQTNDTDHIFKVDEAGSSTVSQTSVTSNSSTDEYRFTNTKGALIPTGLIENTVTYGLLALLAAGALLFFVYKRKKDTIEEEV
ncbi:MAG: hypothetical protein IJH61_03615 [Eubacteriaceae bacterium]|nr:hypothetical protein [Eubacteriaceae bacterium]